MSSKQINLPDIGQVNITKRRGMKNMRVSVKHDGLVQITMPKWAPYSFGEMFARRHIQWIKTHRKIRSKITLKNGNIIGKSAVLNIEKSSKERTIVKVSKDLIYVSTPLKILDPKLQETLQKACEKSLKLQANDYLKIRLDELSHRHKLKYRNLSIKKLRSRWGSCSAQKNISLSIYMMQLPDELIDYVLVHELIHTKHLNHGKDFWDAFELTFPNAKSYRHKIRHYSPTLTPRNSLI